MTDDEYKQASNIFFTNGGLDPWSGASPTKTLTPDLPACFMGIFLLIVDYGAHHLDLRSPNPADPQQVVDCRTQALTYIKKWIGWKEQPTQIRSE